MDLKIIKEYFSTGQSYLNDFKSYSNNKYYEGFISLVEYIVKTVYKICIVHLALYIFSQ